MLDMAIVLKSKNGQMDSKQRLCLVLFFQHKIKVMHFVLNYGCKFGGICKEVNFLMVCEYLVMGLKWAQKCVEPTINVQKVEGGRAFSMFAYGFVSKAIL
jgi:hypothetical protein